MNPNYQPRGIVLKLLPLMEAEPERAFTTTECADIMGCKLRAVGATLLYATKARRVFKRTIAGRCEYSATELPGSEAPPPTKHPERARPMPAGWATDPDDPRIGKVVPNWKPPVMRHVRGGA